MLLVACIFKFEQMENPFPESRRLVIEQLVEICVEVRRGRRYALADQLLHDFACIILQLACRLIQPFCPEIFSLHAHIRALLETAL